MNATLPTLQELFEGAAESKIPVQFKYPNQHVGHPTVRIIVVENVKKSKAGEIIVTGKDSTCNNEYRSFNLKKIDTNV